MSNSVPGKHAALIVLVGSRETRPEGQLEVERKAEERLEPACPVSVPLRAPVSDVLDSGDVSECCTGKTLTGAGGTAGALVFDVVVRTLSPQSGLPSPVSKAEATVSSERPACGVAVATAAAAPFSSTRLGALLATAAGM